MRSKLLVLAMQGVLSVGAGGLATDAAWADGCNCSYGGATSREFSVSCSDPGEASCTCTSNGCMGTCHAAGITSGLSLSHTLHTFKGRELRPAVLRDWVGALPESLAPWTISSTIEDPPSVDVDYTEDTWQEVLDALAVEWGGCVDIDDTARTIAFKPSGCS